MDIIRFKGGLGNQMFQYAFYQALKSRDRVVKASLGYYKRHPDKMSFCLTDVFPQIAMEYVSDEEFQVIDSAWKNVKSDNKKLQKFLGDYENRFFWVEDMDFFYREEVFQTQNCTFVGYWQSERYFQTIREVLLRDFEFPYGEQKLEDLRKEFLHSKQYAAVHIRRGDYLKDTEAWGNLSESSYYSRAIAFIKKAVNPRLVFFSDDIQWVKENYRYENAMYIEESMFRNYKPWYDMCLMSSCAHNIIANSSFSWWGAWLNRNDSKIVAAPEKWFFDGRSERDICPEGWIRISES